MPSRIHSEIKQTRPFASREQEALLTIERTAAVLLHRMAEFFKVYGITPTQFNVLRILRGAGRDGLSRNEVRDRLVAQVPDVTRLIDRLEECGLVERERDRVDRRVVMARITVAGMNLLDRLDGPLLAAHHEQLGHMTAAQLDTLIELLDLSRSRS